MLKGRFVPVERIYYKNGGGGIQSKKKVGHQRPVFGSNVTNELDTIDTK